MANCPSETNCQFSWNSYGYNCNCKEGYKKVGVEKERPSVEECEKIEESSRFDPLVIALIIIGGIFILLVVLFIVLQIARVYRHKGKEKKEDKGKGESSNVVAGAAYVESGAVSVESAAVSVEKQEDAGKPVGPAEYMKVEVGDGNEGVENEGLEIRADDNVVSGEENYQMAGVDNEGVENQGLEIGADNNVVSGDENYQMGEQELIGQEDAGFTGEYVEGEIPVEELAEDQQNMG